MGSAECGNQRKKATETRARGKAGFRAVEAALESANLVVQRVETENDIGRDAFVELVDGTDVTGGVICVQIKSGRASHYRSGQWLLPGAASDFTLWRESSLPFFGVVHDEVDDALRWVDLSDVSRLNGDRYLADVVTGPYGRKCVVVPETNRLDLSPEGFIDAARHAIRRARGNAAASLLSSDPATVEMGIYDSFASGRYDADALMVLGALFHRLPKKQRATAIAALAMATPHPDVFWTRSNWIPDAVCRELKRRTRWTQQDASALIQEIDESGIQRGSLGQSVFHVLQLDAGVEERLFHCALDRGEPDHVRLWATVIVLYLAASDAPGTLERLLRRDDENGSSEALFSLRKALAEVEHFDVVVQTVREFGAIDLF